LVSPFKPLQAEDKTGKWGVGLHGGVYKLGLTDRSDIWTLGWLGNADVTYRVNPKLALGVESNLMQTYLANLNDGTKWEDGAGLTTDKLQDGPKNKAFLVGLLAEYHFLPEKKWSPFVSVGSGLYSWKWVDNDGNTLISNNPMLAGLGVPAGDLDGASYELKDQELYAMAGLGVEYFPSPSISVELGTKFRYLTHLFTDFKDRQDIVGTDPGQLDLPKGIGEVYAGLTFHFGGEKKCPPLACEATANPTTGSPTLAVQFAGSISGGCPPHTYLWDFGDGATSTGLSPSHLYQAVGNYTAQLTVTDAKGMVVKASAPVIAVTCPPMSCKAGANPTSGTTPLSIAFSASAEGGCPPYTYSWVIGDGSSSTVQNPTHRIEQAGSYTARVTVTDSKGNRCRDSVSYSAKAAEFIPPPEKPLVLKGVNFESSKAVLLDTSKTILDRVAVSLKEHPDVKVEIGGHCDSQGPEAYNLKLSTDRANAVRDYLISKGVAADQLVAVGYGESQPIADNGTKEGRAENRRVELKRIQ